MLPLESVTHLSVPEPVDPLFMIPVFRERGGSGGLPWLPVVEQCSEVYFFFGTRALKVAVFRLEAGFGLLLALGVLLLLQLLPPLSFWLLPPTVDLPHLSSVNSLPGSINGEAVASDSPSLCWSSISEVFCILLESMHKVSLCELQEKEDIGVLFCGDRLLSLFSSESLLSPPSGASPIPRRLPPLARVDGGERRPCFFIGFMVSCNFSPEKSFQMFIPEIFFGVPLLLCLVFIHISLFYSFTFCPVFFQ